jgi:hypothetical protein
MQTLVYASWDIKGVPWMCHKMGGVSKWSTEFCTGEGKLMETATLPADLSTLKPHPAVNHPVGGRLGNWVICGTWNQSSHSCLAANHMQQKGRTRDWVIHQPWTWNSVSAVIFRQWGLFLATEDGVTIHHILYCSSSLPLKFLSRSMSDLLPVYDYFSWSSLI